MSLLTAITNLVSSSNIEIEYENGEIALNIIQAEGRALERYVKDLFSGAILEPGRRAELYANTFSWPGSANHIPDAIIRNSDALEIKKMKTLNGNIALNSSYPKSKLLYNDRNVNNDCRACEEWEEKDIIYCVGSIPPTGLKLLWFVYGDCYFREPSFYSNIHNELSSDIYRLPNWNFTDTDELFRLNSIDERNVTNLRVRGMWEIKHPSTVFSYLNCIENGLPFQMHCIMKEEKYNGFPQNERQLIENLISDDFTISNVEIYDPNNIDFTIVAKLISFKFRA